MRYKRRHYRKGRFMPIGLTGHQGRISAPARAVLAGLALAATLALGACTTVEGTNALTDVGTFEREVLNTTARGVGLIPGDAPKEDLTKPRAPLALPRTTASLPAPTTEVAAAQLPANSDTVRIDASNLSEADIQRLRNAKVVDLRSLSGRPLTPEEARSLTTRMSAAGMQVSAASERPLYLPPDEYSPGWAMPISSAAPPMANSCRSPMRVAPKKCVARCAPRRKAAASSALVRARA